MRSQRTEAERTQIQTDWEKKEERNKTVSFQEFEAVCGTPRNSSPVSATMFDRKCRSSRLVKASTRAMLARPYLLKDSGSNASVSKLQIQKESGLELVT
ncbi:hypothetical protein EYF80_025586 [Liparis tanakae]|uniref:Uncharacterized protein n=1 Tax=Liparis tanakae TaxID=230148 RepID=A0A4Z2HEB1_9TELE|nr:hypothetical protein EYF80_025586 [Liparis tanakae]